MQPIERQSKILTSKLDTLNSDPRTKQPLTLQSESLKHHAVVFAVSLVPAGTH